MLSGAGRKRSVALPAILRRGVVGSWRGNLGFGIPWTGGSSCLLRVLGSSIAQQSWTPYAFAGGITTPKAESRRYEMGSARHQPLGSSLRTWRRVLWGVISGREDGCQSHWWRQAMRFVLVARRFDRFFFVVSTKTLAEELRTTQTIDCRVSRGCKRKTTPRRKMPSR